jgi:hypothetical protein
METAGGNRFAVNGLRMGFWEQEVLHYIGTLILLFLAISAIWPDTRKALAEAGREQREWRATAAWNE